jgi:hypothetical protein
MELFIMDKAGQTRVISKARLDEIYVEMIEAGEIEETDDGGTKFVDRVWAEAQPVE